MRAKFRTISKRKYLGYCSGSTNVPLEEVVLSAVAGEENKPWSSATPSGELKMSISNPVAVDFFELGKEYYIDFTLVEKEN